MNTGRVLRANILSKRLTRFTANVECFQLYPIWMTDHTDIWMNVFMDIAYHTQITITALLQEHSHLCAQKTENITNWLILLKWMNILEPT